METIYINKGIKNAARRLALGCLLLFASFGSLVAQNDPLFVIKKDGNYLAHVKVNDEWVIQNATMFSPNCLWYSSNNYNYYLLDGDDRMYLKAPLECNGAITIAPNPGTNHLGLTTQDYFFYDWDKGLARGVQEFHENGSCPIEYNIGDNSECWKAVWVSYENSQWQMSSVYGYDQTTYAADFYPVTVTEHAMVVTPSGESDLGLTALDVPETMEAGSSGEQISATIENFAYTYIPAYTTYFFDGGTHNYYDGSDHDNSTPSSQEGPSTSSVDSYEWTISCEGRYLTFDDGGEWILTSHESSPTIYYPHSSTEGRKVATITLTVTYANTGATQTMSKDVVLLVDCQNPGIIDEEITYQGVTISWYPTADAFQVMWKINDENVTEWNNSGNLTTTTYTFPGLEYSTSYLYKVKAICTPETDDPTQYDFTTLAEPNLVVAGAIFGGGRMANVTGNTEVVVVNCDYIDAVYGGNDIAGEVQGADGAKITIGVNTGDTNGYDTDYGTTDSPIKIGSVYGGGNGYYAYNGTSFVPATENYTSETVDVGASVNAMTQSHTVGDVVWTNDGTNPETLNFPSIVKTAITVSNDFVNVDSIFGGAKNAFLTTNNGDGSLITVNGGTVMAVFGGNNFGGDQGYGKHHIEVNGTTTSLVPTDQVSNTATTGFGREFGIRYLYGGGNKVYGSTTEVFINGGQCDTIFAGGNAADVYAANLTVNCAIAAGSDENTYGHVYSNAIATYDGSTITPKDDYEWDGISGIYNIRTLFGGNNQADFDSRHNNKVPTITLTSGSIGTVYGGGNAGNMLGLSTDDGDGDVLTINGNTVKYGTHVAMNSANVLVDKLYGGCQVSDVSYSTWVEIQNGHVGYVFGGCNVSGDVGSTRVNMAADENNPDGSYQEVYGGTYVVAQGGTVYKNLFAGGNGYYHCVDENGFYTNVLSYDDPNNLYVGLSAPTHNETNVVVQPGATVKGNVYAGGNLAYVGFNNNTVGGKPYPKLVGLASVRMSGGEVFGNVYGGGNMADVYGSNEVQVSGGTIHQSLYGGNDRMGKVAQMTNRKLPESYNTASDGVTSLLIPKVNTYVSLTKNPHITNVYGGGNGYYAYFNNFDDADDYDGPKETVVSCDISNEPIQSSTFVDIAIDGGAEGGQIGTVYGGGDGVSVEGSLRVFLNVQGDNPTGYTNVGTIFGGNNKGNLELVSDIILLKGQVGTVYGGCNEGAMEANISDNLKTIGGYTDIGSYVRLLSGYDGDGSGPASPVIPEVVVTEAIYGGCRMNGVTRNSLVLVEGGNFSNIPIFGGSDISGTVSGWSRVAVTSGTVGNVYGGGNGNYDYVGHNVYVAGSDHNPADLVATSDDDVEKPHCVISGVDMISGTATNLYGGGNACGSGATVTNVEGGTVSTGIYGGSNASGTITGDVVVNVTGGTIGVSGIPANIHGGGFGAATTTDGDVTVNIGATDGGETPTYSGTAIIWGDVYGGSALGEVSASDKETNVNFYKGTINGDVYGGGLGNNTYPAEVSGDVLVNVYGGVFNGADGTLGGGNIYGCNNANGSPLGDVEVNIYATDHNLYPTAPGGGWTVANLATNAASQTYAINQVFGGGNQAAYIPAADKTATVHVYNCDNTIRQVFGGGNAADVGEEGSTTNTFVIIDGGRFHQVYGGGNGYSATGNHTDPEQANYNPGANIFGTASSDIYAGLIDEIFGGANQWGSVDVIDLNVSSSDACTDEVYGKVFGCANEAPYNKSVTTTIECGVGTIGELYGGSNQASIGDPSNPNTGVDVTLNLYGGGPYNYVFAGSKGAADKAADIYGNVTLNLYGGNIINAFGGSDVKGNITGLITVNVLDYEAENCGLDLTNVYGASNQTAYNPNEGYKDSPVINVMHIKQDPGIRGNVFGGGNQGAVTANPIVNIGYDATSMSALIPEGYSIAEANRRAYVTGSVYGGGNEAGVTSPTVNIISGTVADDVYGGCNTNGTVTGDIAVNLTGGTVGNDVFGGGKGNATATQGNVTVTIEGGTVTRDVYGGSALGQVNDETTDLTKVWLKSGTVGGNLYGGGMGVVGTPDDGQLNGEVEVHVNGGTVIGSVFGCNNYNEQPAGAVKVYINETTPGTMSIGGNVYGGGNVAYYEGTPEVFIQNGTVDYKVFGGGNNITIDGKGVSGSHVVMTGGTVLEGIYGGCNTDGDVTGNSIVDIYGGTIGSTTAKANIHGGGYGQNTRVLGDVTVSFGQNGTTHNGALILYGDLYGGSALGSVNSSLSNTTTVNVLNGIIQGTGNDPANDDYYGNVFGGGLGQKTPVPIEAIVNGKVYVNIGTQYGGGQASLARCNVYGCNNQNGSPQDDVYVDVWETYHTVKDEVGYYGSDASYAIYQVFGGGNQAHYEPENGLVSSPKKTHVTVHNCDNTIQYVYGGGNAANAVGVETIVLGGRFREIYGGGNGREIPAHITGPNGIGINVVAGNVGFLFEGSNKEGTNQSGIYYKPDASSECLGGLFVDSYFFGTNEAELYGDLTNMITCADAGDFEYRYVYAGSRWGIVYGNINLMVCGGTIENLFGGCRGYENYSADVRRFPTAAEIAADEAGHYSAGVRAFLEAHPEYYGHGGNINLVITGGTIGNVFGGCDIQGNVEGKITVTVSEREGSACPLFVGNVYGASNQWYHTPEQSDIISPDVSIIRGTIGGTHPDLPVNNIYGVPATAYEGNVFGGGNHGNVTANPRVIVGDSPDAKVTIKGNVYGGGNEGNITGSPQVIVIPEMHSFSYSHGDGGTIVVKDGQDQDVSSSDQIGEGISLSIMATPQDYAHTFNGWTVTGTGASIAEPSAASTTFTMGTTNASISASFEAAASAPALTLTTPSGGTFNVTGPHGIVTGTTNVATGTVFTISATPDVTHRFSNWSVSGTGSTIANSTSATTTFTMGTADASISAVFDVATTHTFTFNTSGNGSVTVTYRSDNTVNTVSSGASIGEGAVLNIVAIASSGYAFSHWTVEGAGSSVANTNNPSTTFTMGTDDVTLTANFVTTHTLTITEPSNGTVRVTNSLGQEVNSGNDIGEDAKLNLKATPASGYAFQQWTIIGEGSSVEGDVLNRPTTTFTMGTENAYISATFITAHLLTVESEHGTIEITSPLGQNMSNPASIGEGVVVTIKATPADGYTFVRWEIVGDGDGEIGDANTSPTTFTMGTQNTTIRAVYNEE